MESRYLATLVKVVETGSISRAAEVLHLTQSAVSQRIKFLEERFDRELLNRSGPVLVPTPAGEVVLVRARRILEQERELERDLGRLDGRKRLAFCCTPTFGMAFLPAVLNAFVLRHSDLADLKVLFLQPEQILKGLSEQEFDLAVIEYCADLDFEGFDVVDLGEDELVFISSSSLGLPERMETLESLLGHRLYARRDGCSSKELLRGNLEACGRQIEEFRSVVVSDDLRLTIDAVARGDGISFVSSNLVAEGLKAGNLRAHRLAGFNHFRRRALLVNPALREDALIASFTDCVREVVAQSRSASRPSD